jgi:hypothetical protein
MAKHLPGPPMTLGNMRHLGVRHLVATCLNDACRHRGLIDVIRNSNIERPIWGAVNRSPQQEPAEKTAGCVCPAAYFPRL